MEGRVRTAQDQVRASGLVDEMRELAEALEPVDVIVDCVAAAGRVVDAKVVGGKTSGEVAVEFSMDSDELEKRAKRMEAADVKRELAKGGGSPVLGVGSDYDDVAIFLMGGEGTGEEIGGGDEASV